MLLKGGSWSKKIEVAKAMKGDEISVHLISSEYGKPWKHIYIVTKKRKKATCHLVPIFCILLNEGNSSLCPLVYTLLYWTEYM